MENNSLTINELEAISSMIGITEFFNQEEFKKLAGYDNFLESRIKNYILDENDFSAEKYFKNARNCLENGLYSGALMYLEKALIKSYNCSSRINKMKTAALKIYEKNGINPEKSFNNAKNLALKVSKSIVQ